MNILQDKKKKVLTKIDALKQINDNPSILFDSKNNVLDNSVKDIYSELIEMAENLISNSGVDKLTFLDSLKNDSYDAVESTTLVLRELYLNLVKKSFFVGEGICGTETNVDTNIIRLKPQEFDYFDMFKVNPETTIGKVVYENDKDNLNKVNLEFHQIFSGGTYEFRNLSNEVQFSITWDSVTQEYVVTLVETNVREFFNNYYNNINYPKLNDILKRNLTSTLKDNTLVSKKTIQFDNMLQNLFGDCSSSSKNEDQRNQTFIGVQENYTDTSGLFNFDDVEGIELETINNVMTFRTCYDIDIPTKKGVLEELFYFEKKQENEKINIKNLIEESFDKVVLHSSINSKFQLNVPNIKIAFIKDFIINLPKVLIHNLFSPKYLFPIVLMYKKIKGITNEISMKDIFNELKKLFVKLITTVFWTFVSKYWILLKKSIVKELKKITKNFTKNKLNRYLLIITSLINIFKKIPFDKFNDCNSLYSMVLQTINTLISTDAKVQIPNMMLLLSERLSGYSQDRAFLNIIENLNGMGINTQEIYGESNNVVKIVKSIINGNTTEMDENSYIKIVLSGGILPSGPGGTVIPPGAISGVGKMF